MPACSKLCWFLAVRSEKKGCSDKKEKYGFVSFPVGSSWKQADIFCVVIVCAQKLFEKHLYESETQIFHK